MEQPDGQFKQNQNYGSERQVTRLVKAPLKSQRSKSKGQRLFTDLVDTDQSQGYL